MNLNIYTIHDSAAEAFLNPFFMHNDGLAIRAFTDNVNAEEENNISKHPEQFCLFKVGQFNDQTGMIEPLEAPKALTTGLEVKNPTTETELKEELATLRKLISTLKVK